MLLVSHIVAGSFCLLTGAINLSKKKNRGRHTINGECYHGVYLVVFITSVGMAMIH